MFKKSPTSIQFDLFSAPQNLLSGKALKIYQNNAGWHNAFRNQVTMGINEDVFSPLYTKSTGSPNASIRILVAMMVLKEANGISDEKLFEDCRFNLLTKSAIGLLKADDKVPTESTYYLFRKQIDEYEKLNSENLLDTAFTQLTKSQSVEFDVSGKRIRMDSKLIGSNIAWMSRYELIHETLSLFYKQIKDSNLLGKELKEQLDELLKMNGQKVVYTQNGEEVKTRLNKLGELISELLVLFSKEESNAFKTLQKVFEQQFELDDSKIVIPRKKEEISPKSIQSPHDTECHYRNKDSNQVKGYSLNVTESCNDDGLNLIGAVDLRVVTTADVDFLEDDINKVQKVFTEKTENAHADGAYNSPKNQLYCKENGINLHLHAIQGAKGRYELTLNEEKEITIFDRKKEEFVDVVKITSKKGHIKWRIVNGKRYRYFTQKDIDTANLRRKIEQTPIEVLQKRNNVEATIFQIGYHYPNAKSRYRGLNRHQMWANIRCIWVNFVRILKHIGISVRKAQKNAALASFFSVFNSIVPEMVTILALRVNFRLIIRHQTI